MAPISSGCSLARRVSNPAFWSVPFHARTRLRARPPWFGTIDLTLDVTDAAIAAGKPWLLGEQFTAADIIIGATVRWGVAFKLLPERPHFAEYIKRIEARPAFQRATALDAQ